MSQSGETGRLCSTGCYVTISHFHHNVTWKKVHIYQFVFKMTKDNCLFHFFCGLKLVNVHKTYLDVEWYLNHSTWCRLIHQEVTY